MNVQQALEVSQTLILPGFLNDDESLSDQRRINEEAISVLIAAYFENPQDEEPFSFDVVRKLADTNRMLCDEFGVERLQELPSPNLATRLSNDELLKGVAKLQHRSMRAVAKSAGFELQDLGVAYVEKPVSGAVIGLDIETTAKCPERGYIINIGVVPAVMANPCQAEAGFASYFGLPERYKDGVPLSEIHGISWHNVEGKTSFRDAKVLHKTLVKALKRYPLMAHNAAFEDSWLLLHLDGYAEAKRAGKITIIDTRDICRRIDPDVRLLPHESSPAALENWARRRNTLAPDEKERHLGLEDVFLMLDTVCAEFDERNMLNKEKEAD